MELTVIENMITCLYFLAAFGLILLANFIYDVWKNRKRDYVGEIRRGELAIENDDVEALKVCYKRILADYYELKGYGKYYFNNTELNEWDCNMTTTLPTIKASELIKHLNK